MRDKEKIKVFVVEDHESFSDGLRLFFQHSDCIQFVGHAKTEDECLAKTKHRPIDVILMDIKLGNNPFSGFEIVKKLHIRAKQVGEVPTIVFLTGIDDKKEIVVKAKELNCSLLNKNLSIPTIIERIKNIHYNRIQYIEGQFDKAETSNRKSDIRKWLQTCLTPKQGLTAIYLFLHGSNAEIAKQLDIRKATVNTHLRDIYRSLDLSNESNPREKLIKMISESGLASQVEEVKEDPKDWFKKL